MSLAEAVAKRRGNRAPTYRTGAALVAAGLKYFQWLRTQRVRVPVHGWYQGELSTGSVSRPRIATPAGLSVWLGYTPKSFAELVAGHSGADLQRGARSLLAILADEIAAASAADAVNASIGNRLLGHVGLPEVAEVEIAGRVDVRQMSSAQLSALAAMDRVGGDEAKAARPTLRKAKR